jgi:glycosyltransferase involved in cell wall biosynthesis
MKVLHLISGGDTGGAKTHIISLIKGLDKLIDAKVVCFIEDTFYEDAKKEGIDIDVYEQKNRSDLSVVKRLANLVNEEGFDIVHCHGARANFIAMFLKNKINTPMITTIHSDYKLDFKDNLYKRLIFTTLNTIALKKFKYFIAISDTFKDMLVERGFKRNSIFVSYNGIDFESDLKYVPKSEFLSKYNIDYDGKIIVGILARLDLVKDHETFIKAAKEVLTIRDDIVFLIGGSGNNENRLKHLVSDFGIEKNVSFLGYINDPDSFMNAIDINVLTSVSESFPYVILEGARMAKPVISTNVGGISNLIKDGYNGYLIDVGDYKMLAERILTFSNNKSILEAMGLNLFKEAKANYSYDSMAKTHIEIYKKILENKR